MGHFIFNAFSFFGDFAQQHTSELMRAFTQAASKWIEVSTNVGKMVAELWCGKAKSADPETHEEPKDQTIAEHQAIEHVEGDVAKADEPEAAQECFTQDRRLRRPRKKHNGVQRSTKKKGSKCRAAYALRGVNGQVASPLCA